MPVFANLNNKHLIFGWYKSKIYFKALIQKYDTLTLGHFNANPLLDYIINN